MRMFWKAIKLYSQQSTLFPLLESGGRLNAFTVTTLTNSNPALLILTQLSPVLPCLTHFNPVQLILTQFNQV